MTAYKTRKLISTVLILVAIALLYPIHQTPVWWVSLLAPNYPAESFPKGVRIHFHVNGVFNGCDKIARDEIQSDVGLDCVHEMDTINHYVGMYPIAAGGPVELCFSLFLIAFVAVLLLGFLFDKTSIRMAVLALGFIGIATWMGMTWYGENGIERHSSKYISGRISVLGQEGDDEEVDAPLTSGEAIIARLKASLEGSGDGEESGDGAAEAKDKKSQDIAYLKDVFDQSQKRAGDQAQEWNGSASQVLAWHYEKSLGKYFNDPEVIGPMAAKMKSAGNVTFWAVLVVIALLIIGAVKTRGVVHWFLLLIPMLLPVFFLIAYAAWLWWYGHNMNDMGAFTLKPFMPTVFGEGKVAQFSTNSYPHIGFFLMIAYSLLLATAALLRRKSADDADH